MPLVIHDLQDSQMFALAQAAGRAGLPVVGTSWPVEPWVKKSRYVQKAVALPCLGEVVSGVYAMNLKKSGLKGVWLPCVDDMAGFTAEYAPFLSNIGMRFLSADPETIERAITTHELPVRGMIRIPDGEMLNMQDLYDGKCRCAFPLMLKTRRNGFMRVDDAASLRQILQPQIEAGHGGQMEIVQRYIAGSVERMASAIVLFDDESRPVRGFTGRRLRVAQTHFGAFGETTAARAEWIPELYEGACELLSHLGWRGFAEVECKQDENGAWQLMEINPRLSGWTCLAEADGAGFLQAYYRICSEEARLDEACLQRSRAEYVRMIGTCYHDPDWDAETPRCRGLRRKVREAVVAWRLYHRKKPEISLGAWDGRDLQASLRIAWRSIVRAWKIAWLRKKKTQPASS